MAIHIRRREFITLLGGAAVSWPLAARAQQRALSVIGFFNQGVPESSTQFAAAFRKGLGETGYVEGQNVTVEYRWGYNDDKLLPELAADLVRRRVSVIATPMSTSAALAAKAATTTIPIIFGTGGDPVQAGLVTSFNRPGGNITGVTVLSWQLAGKRLGWLHELLPTARRFAVLVNPKTPGVTETFIKEVQIAAATLGSQIDILTASTNPDIDTALADAVARKTEGLIISPDLLFNNRRVPLVALTLRHVVPTIFPWREAVEAGGLMSYGASFSDAYRQVGIYTGRILNGDKPGDLPVVQASKFELVINSHTAKTLGLTLPPTLLASADEVIE
jgi:putative tryptophan/tyrosine transport system substrate-binding protein